MLRWLALSAFALLGFLRAPHLFFEPRFWAEEGALFYAAATRPGAGWIEGLTFLPRHVGGYWSLCATIPTTMAAQWASVERAPLVTTLFSFALWLVPLALILFGRSQVFTSLPRKLVGCAIIVLAPSALGEVWLNSINAQVTCGFIALVILCEDLREVGSGRLALYLLLLAFCGLSGPYAAFLFPGFALKAHWLRSRAAYACLAVITVTATIQGITFLYLWNEGAISDSKFVRLDWIRSAFVVVYGQVLTPLGLKGLAQAVAGLAGLEDPSLRPDPGWDLVALALLCIAGLYALAWLLYDRRRQSQARLLLVVYLVLMVLTTAGSTLGRAYGRYAVLPGATLLFLLLSQVQSGASSLRSRICAGVIGFALLMGASGFRDDPALSCGGCATWTAEVRRWRSDPHYHPQIWPLRTPAEGPQWRVIFGVPWGPSYPYMRIPDRERHRYGGRDR